MASMICSCGDRLTDNSVPNDIQLWVYTDKEWDSICTVDTIETWKIPQPTYDVWRCPKCERIYVFDWESGKPLKVYALEEDVEE